MNQNFRLRPKLCGFLCVSNTECQLRTLLCHTLPDVAELGDEFAIRTRHGPYQ